MKLREKSVISILFILLLALSTSAYAQDTPESQEEISPQLTDFVYIAENAEIRDLYAVVFRLLDPGVGATAAISRQSNSMVITDTKENIERILAILKKLDKPNHNLQLTFHVIKAAMEGSGDETRELPAPVRESLKAVSEMLGYKAFSVVDSGMLTTDSNGNRGELSLSNDLALGFKMSYNKQNQYLHLQELELVNRGNDYHRYFRTDCGLRNNEVIVAGVSKLNGGDEALLVVVSLRVDY